MKISEQFQKLKDQIIRLKKFNRLLGIFAGILLLGWGFSVFIFSQEDSGIEEAAAEVEQLAENIRRYYQNRPDYWGLSTQMVLDKKIYPNKMLKENKLTGFFGNPVLVGSGSDGAVLMPGSRNFDIIYKNLNKKQCTELAAFRFNQKFWLGVIGITIMNDKGQQLFSWNDEENRLPIKKSQAKAACRSDNVVIWHYEQ